MVCSKHTLNYWYHSKHTHKHWMQWVHIYKCVCVWQRRAETYKHIQASPLDFVCKTESFAFRFCCCSDVSHLKVNYIDNESFPTTIYSQIQFFMALFWTSSCHSNAILLFCWFFNFSQLIFGYCYAFDHFGAILFVGLSNLNRLFVWRGAKLSNVTIWIMQNAFDTFKKSFSW